VSGWIAGSAQGRRAPFRVVGARVEEAASSAREHPPNCPEAATNAGWQARRSQADHIAGESLRHHAPSAEACLMARDKRDGCNIPKLDVRGSVVRSTRASNQFLEELCAKLRLAVFVLQERCLARGDFKGTPFDSYQISVSFVGGHCWSTMAWRSRWSRSRPFGPRVGLQRPH
jgi:hypothetical protein